MISSDPRLHPERVVRLLAELVSIPSVNVDRKRSNALHPEAKMVDFLEAWLAEVGCHIERRAVRAGRENLLARLPGVDRSKTLVLEAHTDTVGVAGMTVEPHRPQLVEGRMTGRGTCDTKGSMAAFIEAIHRVASSKEPPAWDVLFVGTMGEETGCEGSLALAQEGFRAEAAIVGEATSCRPMIAHKSAVWWKLSTQGVTAHGSSPHLGVSAVYRMRHILQALEEVVPGHLAQTNDPLLGCPTICCGMISGGEKPNVVPARATVQLDSRILPETDPEAHVKGVLGWIETAAGTQTGPLEIGAIESYSGFRVAEDHPLASLCLSACREELGPDLQPIGGAFFSDAGPLAQTGTPCVVLGPGDISKAHSPDEDIEICQLLSCTRIVEKIIRGIGSVATDR